MAEFITPGRVTLYFALMWSLFVSAKAFFEAVMTSKSDFKGEADKSHKYAHKRSHIVALIAIALVSLYMVFAYLWFDIEDTGLGNDDRTIGVFNVFFINLLWLIIISHFRHERLGSVDSTSWRELLKF